VMVDALVRLFTICMPSTLFPLLIIVPFRSIEFDI